MWRLVQTPEPDSVLLMGTLIDADKLVAWVETDFGPMEHPTFGEIMAVPVDAWSGLRKCLDTEKQLLLDIRDWEIAQYMETGRMRLPQPLRARIHAIVGDR